MALLPSNVTIPKDLSGAMGSIGTDAYSNIGSNYADAKKKLMQDGQVRGQRGASVAGPNSYAGDRLSTAQGLDIGDLQSVLGGGLGSTAYKDVLSQRDYNQKIQLANEAAALNKPSTLEQIMRGIGSIGGPIAKYYGARGNRSSSINDPDYGGYSS